MNEEVEVWKDIEGYEGYYQISNFGRVRGVDRMIPYIARGGKFTQRLQRGKVLKTSVGTSGYETYHMYGESQERETIMLHRVVAKTFLENLEGKEFVNHKDGDKLNNHYSNLEWVTKSENTQHAIETGLLCHSGEDSNLSKITEREVIEILSLRKYGKGLYTCKHITERYGLSAGYVSELDFSKFKWRKVKELSASYDLFSIYNEVTENWPVPEKAKRKSPVNNLSDEVLEQILSRRVSGEI